MAVPALLPLLALVLPGPSPEDGCMGGAGLGGHPSSPSTSAAGGTAGGLEGGGGTGAGQEGSSALSSVTRAAGP